MLIKDVTDCSTQSVKGLDNQLIWKMNQISLGLLTRIDAIPGLSLGDAVHPWLQKDAATSLGRAIASTGRTMIINSAYRTLAGQALLRSHYEEGRCDIMAAAQPGASNHNNASAIDIEEADSWQSPLENNGWRKLGAFDPMHYDFLNAQSILSVSVLAFQKLWNQSNPEDKLTEDGNMGPTTLKKLRYAPAYGFAGIKECPRLLRLTVPAQTGDDVGKVQLALQKQGVNIRADKVYGPETDNAIRAFQRSRNLTSDGVLGTKTFQALELLP